jgi:hypothetical protein
VAAARRVVWVSFAPLEKTPAGITSNVASVRYRITVPAAALKAEGIECGAIYLNASVNRGTLLERFGAVNAVVFGKVVLHPQLEALGQLAVELAGKLRSRGVRVLADFSDDNFLHPQLGPIPRALANGVDRVTASTPGMAEVLRGVTAAPVSVITDPVEGPRGEVRARREPSAPPSLLWFGHPSNLNTLKYGLAQLERSPLAYSLTLVTEPGAGGELLAAELSARWKGSGRECRFRPWSVDTVFEELRRCDAVVIPSNQHDPRKVVKSPNRFTESVWAGRFAIAHPLPAYEELAAYGWVGEDLAEGLQWYAQNPGAAVARVQAGQELVVQRFSPQAVAQAWKAVLLETLEKP